MVEGGGRIVWGENKMKFNPNNREDKMCRMKRQYSGVEEAAQQRVQKLNSPYPLYLYACPYGSHYHLTKHSKPIDSTVEEGDRVNQEIWNPSA